MANFSQDPAAVLAYNRARGYVGIHIEQGVPVLDRDLNLLNDLIWATMRSVFSQFIGDGVANNSNAFQIEAIEGTNDFHIGGPGICLVNGWEVVNTSARQYSEQTGAEPLTATGNAERIDNVYLDVWSSEVTGVEEEVLLNDDDVGMQTSVRVGLHWFVRVAEGGAVPEPASSHAHHPLAEIRRPANTDTITSEMIVDRRQRRLTLVDVVDRLNSLEAYRLVPAFAAGEEFRPGFGNVGQEVTLIGRNFDIGTPRVEFGAVRAAIVGTPSSNELVARIPAGTAQVVNIRVTTDIGQVLSRESFLVTGGAPSDAPQFVTTGDQFSPILGARNQQISLFGQNFNGSGLTVQFGTTTAAIVTSTATQIDVRVPDVPVGAYPITVTTNVGSATTSEGFVVTG